MRARTCLHGRGAWLKRARALLEALGNLAARARTAPRWPARAGRAPPGSARRGDRQGHSREGRAAAAQSGGGVAAGPAPRVKRRHHRPAPAGLSQRPAPNREGLRLLRSLVSTCAPTGPHLMVTRLVMLSSMMPSPGPGTSCEPPEMDTLRGRLWGGGGAVLVYVCPGWGGRPGRGLLTSEPSTGLSDSTPRRRRGWPPNWQGCTGGAIVGARPLSKDQCEKRCDTTEASQAVFGSAARTCPSCTR